MLRCDGCSAAGWPARNIRSAELGRRTGKDQRSSGTAAAESSANQECWPYPKFHSVFFLFSIGSSFNRQTEIISILLMKIITITAVIILHRNLALLISLTTKDYKLKPLRATTVFNLVLFVLAIAFAVLSSANLLPTSERWDKSLATAVISCVMGFAGIISPKLPHNRHSGPGRCWMRIPGIWRTEFSASFLFL